MSATCQEEHFLAEQNAEIGHWAIFQGRNLLRFLIAGWPKIAQQFIGLSVFNSYATYFCKIVIIILCQVMSILSLRLPSSICWQQKSFPRYSYSFMCPNPLHDHHNGHH